MLRRNASYKALLTWIIVLIIGGCAPKLPAAQGTLVSPETPAPLVSLESPTLDSSKPPALVVSPEPQANRVTLTLYFGDANTLGLIKEQRRLVYHGEPLERLVIRELLKGQQGSGHSPIPSEAKLLSVKVEDGIAYLDFSKEMKTKHPGGSTGESITAGAVVYSLTELPGIEKVQFLIEGKIEVAIWGHRSTSEPIGRDNMGIKPVVANQALNGETAEASTQQPSPAAILGTASFEVRDRMATIVSAGAEIVATSQESGERYRFTTDQDGKCRVQLPVTMVEGQAGSDRHSLYTFSVTASGYQESVYINQPVLAETEQKFYLMLLKDGDKGRGEGGGSADRPLRATYRTEPFEPLGGLPESYTAVTKGLDLPIIVNDQVGLTLLTEPEAVSIPLPGLPRIFGYDRERRRLLVGSFRWGSGPTQATYWVSIPDGEVTAQPDLAMITAAKLSPDGESWAIGRPDGLWLWREGAEDLLLFNLYNGEYVSDLCWSPDGQRLAVVTTPAGDKYDITSLYDLTINERTVIHRGSALTGSMSDRLVGWPDSQQLIFYHSFRPCQAFWSYNLHTREQTALLSLDTYEQAAIATCDGRWAIVKAREREGGGYALQLLDVIENITYRLAEGYQGHFLYNGNIVFSDGQGWCELSAAGQRPLPISSEDWLY